MVNVIIVFVYQPYLDGYLDIYMFRDVSIGILWQLYFGFSGFIHLRTTVGSLKPRRYLKTLS